MKKSVASLVCLSLFSVVLVSCNEDDANPVVVNGTPLCAPLDFSENLIAAVSFGGGEAINIIGGEPFQIFNAQPTTDRNGNPDCAFAFQGNAGSYISAGDMDFADGLAAMTVSLWYLPQGHQQGYELLVGRGDENLHCPDTFGEWSVGLHDARKAVFGHANSVWEQINFQSEPEWKFVTAIVNKSDNTISIYINGMLEQTSSGFGSCGTDTLTVEDIGNLYIGKYFDGKIDDITIFNKVLTQADITQLYQMEPCCETVN